MKRTNRRVFLKQTGAVALGAALYSTARTWATTDDSAELILKNGKIVTMSDKMPRAEALAVRGGRILAVGTNGEISSLVSKGTQVVDLAGKSVSPGLIDAHSHLVAFGHMELKFVILRPPKINSFETLKQALAEAAKDKAAGEWIVGRGFDTFKEGRFPRRQELDEAVPRHPLLIIHWGGQFGVANTLALKKANLLREDAKDPYGGKYLRDRKTGLPDGVLIHYPAIYSVHQPELKPGEEIECANWALHQFASKGVTCVHDNFCSPKSAKTYVQLEKSGRLPCRIRVYPYVPNLEGCQKLVQKVRRYSGPLVRLQGVKLAVDGYALMYDIPPEHRELAIPMHPQPLFNKIIATIHDAGLQADVHAVGDKGVDWTLAAYAAAAGSPAQCRSRRHRIEHFPFLKSDTIERAADLGVPVCIQPNFIEVKAEDFQQKFGSSKKKLVDTMVPLVTFTKKGVAVCYGADVPAFPSHAPMDSIRSAMERKTARGRQLDMGESVSFLDALRHHTSGGAYAALDEKELGSLEKGKHADFVIWNRDLGGVKTGKDAAVLEPLATYLEGKVVYQAS